MAVVDTVARGMVFQAYDYVKLTYSLVNNYYVKLDGSVAAFSGFQYIKTACRPGDKLQCTTTISGAGTAMAVFFDKSGNFLSYINVGVNSVNTPYPDFQFTVPNGAYSVAINGINTFPIELRKYTSSITALTEVVRLNYPVTSNYFIKCGDGTAASAAGFKYIKAPCKPGDRLLCNVTVTGAATAMAVFYDIYGNFVSYIKQGTNAVNTPYIDQQFIVPPNCYYVAITGSSAYPMDLFKVINIKTSDLLSLTNNYWTDKNIVWFGTSIPQGGIGQNGTFNSYPYKVGNILGANVYNEAVGSSMARNGIFTSIVSGSDPYGWAGLAWQNVAYSLAATIAEKQELINNWSVWKTKLSNSPPATLDAAEQAKILSCSYENKLVAKHLGANRKDIYVLDHGHNDNIGTDIVTMPTDTRNRGYFLGAMNFLIDLILSDNPRARIVFIGHYENARKTNISLAQQKLADYWSFPFIKLWERLGWSQQTVQTYGYWDASNIWHDTGGTLQTLTITQVQMKDDLHPHSDYSGRNTDLIAQIISEQFKAIR